MSTMLIARNYDPSTGRFLQRDPIGFGGGSFNLYGYVLSDPVDLVDPSGHQVVECVVAIAIVAGVLEWYCQNSNPDPSTNPATPPGPDYPTIGPAPTPSPMPPSAPTNPTWEPPGTNEPFTVTGAPTVYPPVCPPEIY